MAVSDAEFAAWLVADNKRRCVLAEVEAYSGGSTVTRYISNIGFVSRASDTPASTAYDEILMSVPRLKMSMGELFRGQSFIGVGELEIDNSAGVRDSWLNDYIDGRPVRLFLGDPSWPKADFRAVFTGTGVDVKANRWNSLTVTVRDRQFLLAQPVETTIIAGTSNQKEFRSPVCYGECKNITPVLVDAATRRYKFHDGVVQAVDAVYAGGVSVAFTADLANGEFTLTAAATDRVTADVKGSKTGAVYVNTTAQVFQRVLVERAGLTAGDIDAASITAMDTEAPGVIGYYAAADSPATVQAALDEIVTGAGAYFTAGRDGLFRIGLIKAASGTPVVSVIEDDVQQRGISLVRRVVPKSVVKLGYYRNWSPSADGAATALGTASRQDYANENRVTKAVNSVPEFLMAKNEPTAMTLYLSASDAQAEADRRAALWSELRWVLLVRAYVGATRLSIGDVVSIRYPRYGLDAGVLGRVVGYDEALTDRLVTLEVLV